MGSTSTRTLPVKILSVWFSLLICSVGIVMAADPDPLVDVSPSANETFVLRDIFTNGDVSQGLGGTRTATNITNFPASVNEGISFVQFRMAPCGENLPHSHPRATEILTLVSGGPLQAGIVDTSGNAHIYILYPQDVILFPRGLLHFELNVGKEEAFYISALNSQNPGVLTAGGVLLRLPLRAAAGALNTDISTIEKLQSIIYPYDGKLAMDNSSGCVPGKDITPDF